VAKVCRAGESEGGVAFLSPSPPVLLMPAMREDIASGQSTVRYHSIRLQSDRESFHRLPVQWISASRHHKCCPFLYASA